MVSSGASLTSSMSDFRCVNRGSTTIFSCVCVDSKNEVRSFSVYRTYSIPRKAVIIAQTNTQTKFLGTAINSLNCHDSLVVPTFDSLFYCLSIFIKYICKYYKFKKLNLPSNCEWGFGVLG